MKISIRMSILCSLFGLVTGIFVSNNATGEGYEIFPIFSFVASLICSFLLWHYLIVKRKSNSILMGISVGLIIVILSHYFTWYFMALYFYICSSFSVKCLSSLGEKTMNPIQSIYLLVPYTVLSLIIAWITLPLGGFIGAIGVKLQNNTKALEKN
ncbi:MAG TPA: hypothetical protein PK079_02520 [Leptospiraceae bacterium]|nr:hypothetical protein [Leptospiraceae bacterium]HMW04079.1 hypothetical protein [Leptospiraceae bacterium]HMX30854.1 hypothetical protein [Leptospiraceae bacterium]HMY30073.1 hypothetical protein [Leptospiraceae bacterium]HMZ62740.1 hypothetical protein [Leptospiraceae bacterium]